MDKVEEDLTRSKSLREKQAKEFSYQVEELKQKYEQQVSGREGDLILLCFCPAMSYLNFMHFL